MPINPLKDFFAKRKAEVKFARAGPGKKLSSDTGGANSSARSQPPLQAASEAAMKRFNKDSTKPAQRPRVASDTRTQPTASSSTTGESSQEKQSETLQNELLVIDGVAQRDVQVYTIDELAQRIKQPEIDDNFFRLTIEDAKLLKQRYDEEKARNEILKTSEMRKREAETKKPTTNIARLRFKLPNNFVLEASFSGSERLSFVRDWLASTCLDKMELDLENFDILCGLRPFKEGDFEKSLKELSLIPATTLTIVKRAT